MIAILFFFIILYWTSLRCKDKKSIERYNYVVAGLFILLIGFRNEVIYGDTYRYIRVFRDIEFLSVQDIVEYWPKDTFFYITTHYLHPILFHNYTLWLLLIAMVYMLPLMFLVKKFSINPMLSWVCFVFLGLMMFIMAGLRQTVAMGIVMTGFIFLLRGKSIYFFLSIVLAYFFHGTAVVFVVVYPLLKIQLRFSRQTILFYVLVLLFFIFYGTSILITVSDVVLQGEERYLGYIETLRGSTYTYMLQQAILIIPSLYYARRYLNNSTFLVFVHISLIGLLIVSLSPVIAEMFRLSMYFSWANMIIFPLAMMEASKTDRAIQKVFIFLFIIYLFFINKTVMSKYYFFFENLSGITANF